MSKQPKKSKWITVKKAGLLLGVMSLSLGVISGCGGQTATTAYKNETIYGEVTEVKNQKVVLKVGTLKENSKTELDLSEDTASFSINDSTVIKRNALEKPDGNVSEITILSGSRPDGAGGPGESAGNDNSQISYTAKETVTNGKSISGSTIASTKTDENAVAMTSSGTATLENATVTRKSSDSTGGDQASFYGVGAAVLGTKGKLAVKQTKITTDAAGGAGVFAYGDGNITVSDTTITTKQDTSGGIHVAGGGTLTARNVTVTTNGESSAAIRSDRGGGTMKVSGGSYTTNGVGSPAIYSTADVTVKNADLTANGSEAICIEGKNSVKLNNCNVVGNMAENEQNDCTWIVTKDSTLTNLKSAGKIVDKQGKKVTIKGTDGTVYVKGTSFCTVTVTSFSES